MKKIVCYLCRLNITDDIITHALRHIHILSGTIRDLFFKNILVLFPDRYVFQIEIKGSAA
jgi:hypothetical protein